MAVNLDLKSKKVEKESLRICATWKRLKCDRETGGRFFVYGRIGGVSYMLRRLFYTTWYLLHLTHEGQVLLLFIFGLFFQLSVASARLPIPNMAPTVA